MITVHLHLHTILQRQTPQGLVSTVQYACKAGQTISQLMVDLSIDYNEDNLLLVANGQITTPNYALKDGDVVHLIPAISGGQP